MEGAPWRDLSIDVTRLVLEKVPLLQLAKLAGLSQDMSAAYEERVAHREAIISNLPRVSDGNPGSQPESLGDVLDCQPWLSTALPRDLVGVPEGCASPDACPSHFPTESPCLCPTTWLYLALSLAFFSAAYLRGLQELLGCERPL